MRKMEKFINEDTNNKKIKKLNYDRSSKISERNNKKLSTGNKNDND